MVSYSFSDTEKCVELKLDSLPRAGEAHLVGASLGRLKGLGFDSHYRYLPSLWVRTLSWGAYEKTTNQYFSHRFSLSNRNEKLSSGEKNLTVFSTTEAP